MREKPSIGDRRIAEFLEQAYGLPTTRVEFLPLGADANTGVYRVESAGRPYFVKLRKGNFEETSLAVPQFLHEQGIRQVIAPIQTRGGALWSSMDGFACALYPFIEGQDAADAPLSDTQWIEFGAAFKAIHALRLPHALRDMIAAETYTHRWREEARRFQQQAENGPFPDPVAARMAAFMRDHRAEISRVIARAEELAEEMRSRVFDVVLCHSDIHAFNLLITNSGALYIVDWDNPILAPKERDLMFIGGGIGGIWNTSREEELFYRGYHPAEIDLTALAYYRYERIVQDFAAYGEQILLSDAGGEDREQGLIHFSSSFLPGGVIEIANHTYARLKRAL